MTDFSHLEKYAVNDEARSEHVFYRIGCEGDNYITFIVAPAGEANKPYFSALTRYALKNRRAMQNNVNILQDTRDLDRKLYSQFVIKGWKNVIDADGKEVSFSKKSCAEFLECLPHDMFDELREHCAEVDNFAGIGEEDADFSAKNSPSG